MDAGRNTCLLPLRFAQNTSVLCLILTLFIFYSAPIAAATFQINFDELEQPPCDEDGCFPLIIDNQYSSLGVTFFGGALASTEAPVPPYIVSPFNALSDYNGPGLEIHFSGTLPKAVGMYVSAFNQDSVFLNAYNSTGQIGSAVTDGWRGTEETSTPYRDRQLVTLTNSDGIAQITIGTLFARRGTLLIDNLQFGDELSVPLPAGFGLFASALGALWLRFRNKQC